LSDRLAQTLRGIRANAGQRERENPEGSARGVFVARSTDDLEGREDELRGYLTQAGLGILPEVWYPETTESEFRTAMEADLQRSAAFVQLLGKLPGRKADFAGGRRYAALQNEIARSSGKPMFLWRDVADDPASVAMPPTERFWKRLGRVDSPSSSERSWTPRTASRSSAAPRLLTLRSSSTQIATTLR